MMRDYRKEKQIWKKSKPASDFPKDYLVVPALDVIEMLNVGDKK